MSADIELNWEWPAQRAVKDKILVQIKSIEKPSSGLFGIKKSPSLIANLPDPYTISGTVINTDTKLHGENVKITMPKLEIENVKEGSYAMLGMIGNTTCICIVSVDSKDTDLNSISCP